MGCRRRAPAAELVRLVLRPDGSLAVGRGLPGRGAWLCRTAGERRCVMGGAGGPVEAACLDKAGRRGALDRAFRSPVAPGAFDLLRRDLGRPTMCED